MWNGEARIGAASQFIDMARFMKLGSALLTGVTLKTVSDMNACLEVGACATLYANIDFYTGVVALGATLVVLSGAIEARNRLK